MKIFEADRYSLKTMKDKEQLNYSIEQHMKKIKKHSDSKKIMNFFQKLSQYSVKFCGMSWQRNKLWAKELKVSVRTVQRWIKMLVALNIIIVFPTYRINNGGQASNTICILPVIKSIVSGVCHGVCHPVKPSINPLKQENNIYNPNRELLQKYANYKINDLIEKEVTVEFCSSYINKIFKELEKQALLFANAKEAEKRRKREDAARRLIQVPKESLPFYNWLDS